MRGCMMPGRVSCWPWGDVGTSLPCRVTLVCGQLAGSMHKRGPVLWSGDGAGGAAAQLQESPVELADLYNDYAAHFQVRSAAPGAPSRSRLLHRMLCVADHAASCERCERPAC